MIIVNKGADFSACGIGKIPVVQSYTNELMLLYSGSTSIKKYAMQDFFDAIGRGNPDSIYSKIDMLCLPILSKTIGEAFIDVVTSSKKYPGTLNDSTILSSIFDILENGIIIKPGSTSNEYNNKYSVSLNNLTANFFYCNKAGSTSNNNMLGHTSSVLSNSSAGYGSSNSIYVSASSGVNNRCSIIIPNSIVSDSRVITSLGTFTPSNATFQTISSAQLSAVSLLNAWYGGPDSLQNHILPLQIFGWASNLTVDEGVILKNALMTLISVLES